MDPYSPFMPKSLSVIHCPLNQSMQILTQEDWNVVLYNGMASTSPVAALYFVALMTFGNYVLFNLLVAILVEGFQAEVRAAVLTFTHDDPIRQCFQCNEHAPWSH